jgi:putative flippase GtrA
VNLSLQFVRFLVVGLLNTLFGYSVFAGLILAGAPPPPALLISYMVGVLFNFVTTRRFVFNQSKCASLRRFIGAYMIIYLFNLGLYKLINLSGLAPLLTQALCLPVVAVFSFLLFKFQVFKDPT